MGSWYTWSLKKLPLSGGALAHWPLQGLSPGELKEKGIDHLCHIRWNVCSNLVPRAFPSKNRWGAVTAFWASPRFGHPHSHIPSVLGIPGGGCPKRWWLRLCLNYAPINGLPQDGGAGQPTGNLTFSGFQMSISPPLGLHCKSNSHPWGPPEFHLI